MPTRLRKRRRPHGPLSLPAAAPSRPRRPPPCLHPPPRPGQQRHCRPRPQRAPPRLPLPRCAMTRTTPCAASCSTCCRSCCLLQSTSRLPARTRTPRSPQPHPRPRPRAGLQWRPCRAAGPQPSRRGPRRAALCRAPSRPARARPRPRTALPASTKIVFPCLTWAWTTCSHFKARFTAPGHVFFTSPCVAAHRILAACRNGPAGPLRSASQACRVCLVHCCRDHSTDVRAHPYWPFPAQSVGAARAPVPLLLHCMTAAWHGRRAALIAPWRAHPACIPARGSRARRMVSCRVARGGAESPPRARAARNASNRPAADRKPHAAAPSAAHAPG